MRLFILRPRRNRRPFLPARIERSLVRSSCYSIIGVKLNALIVDDSSAVRAFVRAALEEAGFARVVEAATGFEALRLVTANAFDVVIVDINMPDINGLELLSFMRKSPRQQGARKILISTQSEGLEARRGVELGADAFLQKPFDVDELRNLILEVLGRARGGLLA